jgi:hypothetical protein
MSDLAALKARIADELNRSDLTSQIALAIPRAIEKYARERFDFNEGRSTATTVADNQYVDFPTGLRVVDGVYATVGGYTYDLRRVEFDEMEYWHGASNTKGQPLDYTLRKGQLRIYPTPNAAYTLTITGIYDATPAIEAASDGSVTNDWCTGLAEDVINYRVQYLMYRDILKDRESRDEAKEAMKEALRELRGESELLTSDGKVSPGW